MRVLMIRAYGFQAEALRAVGAEVIIVGLHPEHYLGGLIQRVWLSLSRWACRTGNQLGLAMTRTLTVPICFYAAWQQMRRQSIDVVHANAIADLLPAFVLIRMMSRQRRPVLVGSAHSPAAVGPAWKTGLRSIIIGLLCDGFICISHTHMLQLIEQGIDPYHLSFIPNSYSHNWLDDLESVTIPAKDQSPSVLYVAQFSPRKAQHTLLQVAAIVLKCQPDCDFRFVGGALSPKYASDLRQLAKGLGIEKHVCFEGWLTSAEVAQRVVASSVVAFPSQREMMPRAVIEAMVAGKPVVATAVDGILDLIDHGKTGFLLEPGDVDGFACAICSLLEDASLAQQIGQAGRDHVLDECSPYRIGHAIIEFYDRLIGQN